MKGKKVLIISPSYLPVTNNQGGAIEYLLDIFLKFNESKDNDITVYSPKVSKEKYDRQIYRNTRFRIIDQTKPSYKLSNFFIRFMYKFFRKNIFNRYICEIVKDIKKRNEENSYDLIIFENGHIYIEYFRNKICTTSKTVLHLHNDYLNKDTKRVNEILKSFDEAWVVSKFISNRIKEVRPDFNVKVLYNCIEYSRFDKDVNRNEVRDSLNIKKDDFVFLYVGRIIKDKGVLELVKAFNKLEQENVKLVIAGSYDSLRTKITFFRKIQRECSNRKNIILLGKVPNDMLVDYYKISDVQVIPSICNEAFGLIALEGIASGLPLIASNVGGLPEACGTGAIYIDQSENFIEELHTKMEFAYKNYEEIRKGLESYGELIDKYSVENYCLAMNEYINCEDEKNR